MNGLVAAAAPLGSGRAYLALLYALMRIPLGFAYLVLLAVGVSLGMGLLPVGVGVVVLFALLLATRAIAVFERDLGRWWFGFQVPESRTPAPAGGSIWTRLRGFLADPLTWKSAGYVLVQVIVGLSIPLLLLAGAVLAVALLAAPLVALADLASAPPGTAGGSTFIEGFDLGELHVPGLLAVLASVAGGLALAVADLRGAVGFVRAEEYLTGTVLGVSETQRQLAAARTEAASQHARAERLEQSRRELIVSVSHELRTPIASIRGHVEALLDPEGHPGEADTRRYLEIVHRETERLSALVDDLLAVARSDAGELRLDVRPTDVGAVARHVAGALAPIAERDRKVKLVTRLADALPPAWADSDRLGQVLMNLVRNAIAYTPEGGLVAIDVAGAGPQHVSVAVEDTGVGIPPEDLDRIFDRFYRADASRSRATGGFGLGLSISRDLVQAMGGTIEVRSQPGTGSRFTVRLRRAA